MMDKPIVLAVDDTPANLDLLNGILRDKYRVKVAIDGYIALELAKKEPQPDIILLDIMMPGISGYEVCRQLKADPATESIPVIFITAKSEIEDEKMGFELGAVDYVTKPFHQDIVLARLKTHLDTYHKTVELQDQNRELSANKKPDFSDINLTGLQQLIETGEGNQLEFKSTIRWNLHSDKSDKKIENSCLKTVAGYLNSQGGILLIGVSDEGQVLGLNQDHFKTEDKLILHWVNLLKSYLGAEFMQWVRTTAHDIEDERVLVVDCLPATKAVFLARDNDEIFYIRMTNSTQSLSMREVITYIEQRFPDKR